MKQNEAAKRLRRGITANEYLYPQDEKAFLADLDEALATERRNVVEQIRRRLESQIGGMGPDWRFVHRVLDSIATGTEEEK